MRLSPTERRVLQRALDTEPSDFVRWPGHFVGKRQARAVRRARRRLLSVGLLQRWRGYFVARRTS